MRQSIWILAICATLAGIRTSDAIILARTGDPAANTTAPTNDAAGSGWNYEGQWEGFLGTPIAPNFFLAASHIGGNVGDSFRYADTTYGTVASFKDPLSDLIIWQIYGTFPNYAPMYTKSDEVGQRVVAIGKGTQRGTELDVSGVLRGWYWGPGDGVQRWGENLVSQIVSMGNGFDTLYAIFDQNGLTNECHFSSGDSSGAVFIDDGGVWKLTGINYAVDGNFYTDAMGHGEFIAALFDAGGFYYRDDTVNPPQYIQITEPTPTGFYDTRVSSKVAWIESVMAPNGIANAKLLNGPVPLGSGLPTMSFGGGTMSLTYREFTDNAALAYQVQQSTNLVSWQAATTQDSVIATNGNVDTIQSTVTLGPNQQSLFLRVQVTQSTTGQAAIISMPVAEPVKAKPPINRSGVVQMPVVTPAALKTK